jgi:uncharacterized membrane protein
MEKAFILAVAITLVYSIVKYLEMRFLEQKMKPLREIVRDVLMVSVSSFVCSFVFIYYKNKIDDFVAVVTNTNVLKPENTQVFTGVPGF